ncbi:tyrosine-type recombinase/integrase [Maridesulfovibrio zosterae]|uniref:tyrosine-type recombinase/integrase n=1 Tax=Maridesulfovibrio zosterae TaxID=82171 RepID=UPI000408ACA9|nr:tyrosine-type recombinase/integrase [Maridesulfovibrio zosterae]
MSVRQRKDGYWLVDFRDELGKMRCRSFGKGSKGRKLATEFDLEIKFKKSKGEQLPIHRTGGIYLDELCQIWINEKKVQGRKTGWLKDWASVFNKTFAPELTNVPCNMLTQADIMKVLAKHYVDSAQSTRNRYIGYLRAILQYGQDHEHIKKNPLALWQKGKEQSRQSMLTLKDLRKIQKYAPDHLAWAIDAAWNIPVRPGKMDFFSLRYDTNVDFSKGTIKVYHTKVNKWATVHCSKDFLRKLYIARLTNISGHIVEYKGKPVTHMKSSLENASGPKGANLPYPVCLYDIRHLWITTMINHGVEFSTIAYLAGTSVRMIHQNYYEPHSADRMNAAEKLPQL